MSYIHSETMLMKRKEKGVEREAEKSKLYTASICAGFCRQDQVLPHGGRIRVRSNTVHKRGLRKLFMNLFWRDPLTHRLAVPPLPQRGEGRRILSREEEFSVLVLHS